jgi:hypothetical protein
MPSWRGAQFKKAERQLCFCIYFTFKLKEQEVILSTMIQFDEGF